MGQKIHPHGLRVGGHKKWSSIWYGSAKESKDLFFYTYSVEEFLKSLLHLYSYTKISAIKRILVVNVKLLKFSLRQLYIFLFYYKYRTKRRAGNIVKKPALNKSHFNARVNVLMKNLSTRKSVERRQ